MLILAADTSGKYGSIALAKCGSAGSEILEVVPLAGGTFSAQLIPQIASLLSHNGFSKYDVDGFAVVSGPGSFTGLRVGLAAIKALAEVLDKPIAAISLLQCMAEAAHQTGIVLAALDAGRNEIYAGEYEMRSVVTMRSERLLNREEFLRAGASLPIITPDPSIADLARNQGLKVTEIERPGSATIAQLGWTKIVAGETILPQDLDANYIRRSDAEILSKPNC